MPTLASLKVEHPTMPELKRKTYLAYLHALVLVEAQPLHGYPQLPLSLTLLGPGRLHLNNCACVFVCVSGSF